MRLRVIILFCVAATIIAGTLLWSYIDRATSPPFAKLTAQSQASSSAQGKTSAAASNQTAIVAHNLRLHQGPNFRVYVRWLRGHMARTHAEINPSFDDLESFSLNITNGVLRANIGDMSNYLNTANGSSPLKNIVLSGDGSQIKIRGTLHKLIPLPVELTGTISVVSGNSMLMRVTKINVLKVPFKALLSGLHIKVADLFRSDQIPGIEVKGNDIIFDAEKLLPPPHIRGSISEISIKNPDLEIVYGNAQTDLQRTDQWRNYLHLTGGALNFGRLSMNPVDLIMIDISQDDWFDLDLSRYQEQLVDGYTRMTPQAALQIFMPDISQVPVSKSNNVSIEWLKNRHVPPPPSVLEKSAK